MGEVISFKKNPNHGMSDGDIFDQDNATPKTRRLRTQAIHQGSMNLQDYIVKSDALNLRKGLDFIRSDVYGFDDTKLDKIVECQQEILTSKQNDLEFMHNFYDMLIRLSMELMTNRDFTKIYNEGLITSYKGRLIEIAFVSVGGALFVKHIVDVLTHKPVDLEGII